MEVQEYIYAVEDKKGKFQGFLRGTESEIKDKFKKFKVRPIKYPIAVRKYNGGYYV